MHIQTWADIALILFGAIFSLTTVALFAVIAFAVKKIEQQIEIITGKVDPVIAKVTNTLDTVQRITVNVGEKADSILTKGEALTDTVADKVGKTTTTVQETVTTPLINFSSLLSGLAAGLSVWSRSAPSHAKSDANRSDAKASVPKHTTNGTQTVEERSVVMPDGR